ncbi:hypothetical protein Tco_0046903 [Tanacetum coccineum]
MSSNSDDIQATGFDTRPPMLDRTDYESWSQRIRLYCRGKENGLQILQSIDQGPFELGTTRNTLGTTPEGGVLLGPERPRTYEDLSDTEKKRYDADDNVKMLLAGFKLTKEDRESQLYDEFVRFKMLPATLPQTNNQLRTSSNTRNQATIQDGQVVVQNVQERQNQNQRYFPRGNGTAGNGGAHNRAGNANADVDNQPVQDLALNEDNIFQADECDAIFMANLSSAGPANPQAGLSNASILSEVHILENAIDHSVTNQDEHEIHNEVQQANVIDSTSVDMGNSNVIPYEQYLSVDNIFVVPSCASSALNDQRAKFELTEHEQRMDDQMRMLIQNRNKTEENLKKELHSVKLQLNSTMENNKIIEETVTTLKQEFKQKESKFLTDFSNLKHLNDKLENKLHSQYQSIQTVRMMLNPTQVYDQKTKTALDLEKRKAEELKANAPPLPVLPPATVYPPNTPVHLVPRTLPTTSQVNIGLYVITQLFWDFEKTCKKRITPTGITEGERGFEQTKRCYLTKVIPFFNILKEHFDGVQKSLVTEVRAMKADFENLEAEVDQNEIDLKSGEIERKNLYVTNENLIAECFSKDVFYTAIDSVLNVSRFSDMHDAFTIAQKRIADLESKNFNLRNKIQNDDHDSMIKHFSKLEVEHFNLQLKYQNLKERFGNKKPVTSSDAPSFDSLFMIEKLTKQIQKIENLKAQLKENSKCVTISDGKPKVLFPGRYLIDVEPIPPRLKNNREVHLDYIKHLKESVETLREIVEEAKVDIPLDTLLAYACRYTKHSQELLEHVIGTCPKDFNPRDKQNASTTLLRKKLLTLGDQCPLTRNTPPKVLPTKQWKPTGRLLPLERQCPLVRSTALKSGCMPADPQENVTSVAYNLACTNQPDPNCNWGSNVFKSPFSPLFKCKLYRSFSGIWTQAAQNI